MQQQSTFVNVHLQDVKHAITGTPNCYFTEAESVNIHKTHKLSDAQRLSFIITVGSIRCWCCSFSSSEQLRDRQPLNCTLLDQRPSWSSEVATQPST